MQLAKPYHKSENFFLSFWYQLFFDTIPSCLQQTGHKSAKNWFYWSLSKLESEKIQF